MKARPVNEIGLKLLLSDIRNNINLVRNKRDTCEKAKIEQGRLYHLINVVLYDARQRGYLKKNEFLYILEIKSNRNTHGNKSHEAEIEAYTRVAFKTTSVYDAMKSLTMLDGVGIPTGSAILAWVYPNKYGVIDVRSWRQICKYNLEGNCTRDTATLSLMQWERYHEILGIVVGELNIMPQEVDQWLYYKDKEDQEFNR